MYAIGVGNEVDRNELKEIASDSEYVFETSFRALRTIAPLIRTGICEGKSKSAMKVPFTRSVETTIRKGQNMQMCHSLRCKQIDMSTVDQLISIKQRQITLFVDPPRPRGVL